MLSPGLGDLRNVLSFEAAVLRKLRLLHDHQVPAPGEARIRSLGPVDLGPELRADLRIAIGAHLVGIGALEDRQPGRHAPEHLTVLHREPLNDAPGIAERHRPNALPARLPDLRQVWPPATRVTRL